MASAPRIRWSFIRATSVCWLLLLPSVTAAEDWPQWMGPQRDGVWTEQGIIESFPAEGLPVVWRAKISGGYAGPAVAEGRVYVTDYETDGDKSNNPGQRNALDGTERVTCFAGGDGQLIWTHQYPCQYSISYPAGPRATPLVHQGKVYTLGAMGDLKCLTADGGDVVWERDLKKDFDIEAPVWGFSGHPLIDGQTLYCLVGGQGSVAVAFDKDTGKEIWRSLSASEPGYSPPTMIHVGDKKQLIIWHAEAVCGLDPQHGKPAWSVPLVPQYGMSIMAPRLHGNLLYAGGIGGQALLLRLAADGSSAEEVWRGARDTAVYPVCSTPIIDDGVIYGCCQQGQFRAVKLETGERLWETFAPTTNGDRAGSATAFIVKNGDRYFLMSETGDLIIAKLSPAGYEEISRTHLLEPTGEAFGRKVVWSHPAFANRCIFARNDEQLICVSLEAKR